MSETTVSPTYESSSSNALSQRELVQIARLWAPKLGNHAASGQPTDRRWYCRLEWNENYEVWLLGWNEVQSTDFHNHGGASGAVAVAAGSLVESRVDPDDGAQIRQRLVDGGH